ncbi:hypothetical protein B5K11_05170 [Rhizobium leguminosarum bv. trifolii]|nr:hypothetical protein B5K11_05170 [Rhizobium leguminosarum bv. trifolii]
MKMRLMGFPFAVAGWGQSAWIGVLGSSPGTTEGGVLSAISEADDRGGAAPHPAAATFSPLAGRRGYAAASPSLSNVACGTSPRPVRTGRATVFVVKRFAMVVRP